MNQSYSPYNCCVCAGGVCGHTGPHNFCEQHGPKPQVQIVDRTEQLLFELLGELRALNGKVYCIEKDLHEMWMRK